MLYRHMKPNFHFKFFVQNSQIVRLKCIRMNETIVQPKQII